MLFSAKYAENIGNFLRTGKGKQKQRGMREWRGCANAGAAAPDPAFVGDLPSPTPPAFPSCRALRCVRGINVAGPGAGDGGRYPLRCSCCRSAWVWRHCIGMPQRVCCRDGRESMPAAARHCSRLAGWGGGVFMGVFGDSRRFSWGFWHFLGIIYHNIVYFRA